MCSNIKRILTSFCELFICLLIIGHLLVIVAVGGQVPFNWIPPWLGDHPFSFPEGLRQQTDGKLDAACTLWLLVTTFAFISPRLTASSRLHMHILSVMLSRMIHKLSCNLWDGVPIIVVVQHILIKVLQRVHYGKYGTRARAWLRG